MPDKTKRSKSTGCTKTRKMTKAEMQIVCKKSANTFNRFEDDFEKTIKNNVLESVKN